MTPRAGDLVVTRWWARFRGRRLPCSVGRSGIGIKGGEGDGITPAGHFAIEALFLRADRRALATPALAQYRITPTTIWSDDPRDPAYNRPMRRAGHPFSHERMFRPDPLYDLVAVLDYNLDAPRPGKGSAIFLHGWRKPRHPTEGCIAFDPADLGFVLSRWTPGARVITRA